MPRPKGTPKTGGRTKGTPNKVSKSLKELALAWTDEAFEVLTAIMLDAAVFPNVRVAAAREILDRGHGKPIQALTGEGGGPIAIATKVVHEYQLMRAGSSLTINATTAQVIDVQVVSRLTESTLSDTKA